MTRAKKSGPVRKITVKHNSKPKPTNNTKKKYLAKK